MKSLIYQWPALYSLAVRLSYRSHYQERYSTVSNLIPDGVKVVDYCCGDAEIYSSYLKGRNIEYLGIDFNDRFISILGKRGVPCRKLNILQADAVPADYSLMMGSLYQFIPNHKQIVDKILSRTKRLVITEPVKNHASSTNWLVRGLAYALNDPGDGVKKDRFTMSSFKEFVAGYGCRVLSCTEGEIECVAVLEGDPEVTT